MVDLVKFIKQLKAQLESEPGPLANRPTYILFDAYLEAGRKLVGKNVSIPPLNFIYPENASQMKEVFDLIHFVPEIIRLVDYQ